jgi:hypothetical protein
LSGISLLITAPVAGFFPALAFSTPIGVSLTAIAALLDLWGEGPRFVMGSWFVMTSLDKWGMLAFRGNEG